MKEGRFIAVDLLLANEIAYGMSAAARNARRLVRRAAKN
jgi:hypothetical protein